VADGLASRIAHDCSHDSLWLGSNRRLADGVACRRSDECASRGLPRGSELRQVKSLAIACRVLFATQVGLSPSGKRWFYFVTPVECRGRTASPMAYTFVAGSDAYMGLRLDGRAACLWIDNDHLLAPDSILSLALPGYVSLGMTDLPTDRICAGRFPEEI